MEEVLGQAAPESLRRLLVTGGAGFVGGNFVRLLLETRETAHVTVFDGVRGAEASAALRDLPRRYPGRLRYVRGRITDEAGLARLFREEGPFDAVVHFAARNPSGADEASPLEFPRVNTLGTAAVLEAAREAWAREGRHGVFLHLSSYEVYGSSADGFFREDSPLSPSTPYAASKAAADALTLAYHRTFGLDARVTRTTNIYGPYQSRDKLIPSVVRRVREGKAVEIYGTGLQSRDWIHVDDHNRGVLLALERGEAGRVYHLGARCERTNLEVVRLAARAALQELGRDPGEAEGLLRFVPDRRAHDPRRALDPSRAERELGFRPEVPFETGVGNTVRWMLREGW